jgi:MFS family permease
LFFARALTGIGGGGLITLATVINSDIIPPSKRGLFQGFQNILIGLGSILGASLGGFIAEKIGWRFCFLAQVPISSVGLVFGYFYIQNQKELKSQKVLTNIDLEGAFLLVTGLTFQLLSLYTTSWTSYTLSVSSFIILYRFYKVEVTTTRIPIIPFNKIKTLPNYLALIISTLTGFANLAYIFILPLLFQIVLNDSPSKAGLRLGIPSLFTSVGSLITAYFMNKDVKNLVYLVHFGVFLLALGNFLALLISKKFPPVALNFLLIPANTGLGVSNPALLFTFVFAFPRHLQASSTSTLYLFRSIGNVYGVAIISTIILQSLRVQLIKNFDKLDLDQDEIDHIIEKSIRSISYIKTLPPHIKTVVSASYESSIRRAQLISSLVCVFAFILCIVKYSISKAK